MSQMDLTEQQEADIRLTWQHFSQTVEAAGICTAHDLRHYLIRGLISEAESHRYDPRVVEIDRIKGILRPILETA